MSVSIATTLDVRTLVPYERNATFFRTFDTLPVGQVLQLINDHDPMPLRQQLHMRLNGQFDWTYLQSGPDLWRIRISKRAATGASCCSGGACGG